MILSIAISISDSSPPKVDALPVKLFWPEAAARSASSASSIISACRSSIRICLEYLSSSLSSSPDTTAELGSFESRHAASVVPVREEFDVEGLVVPPSTERGDAEDCRLLAIAGLFPGS